MRIYQTDNWGLPQRSTVGTVKDDSLSFNPVTGNLNFRKNLKRSLRETFEYDTLFRLRKIAFNQNINKITFDSIGNILSKTDFSPNYRYHDTLSVYTSPVNYASSQTIAYNSFEKVSRIDEDPYSADFVYNADQERAIMTVKNNGNQFLKRIYAGSSYMKEIRNDSIKEYTFIGGDPYSAPAVIVKSRGVNSTHFFLRDHLGSIIYVVSGSGSLEHEYSYDAWGNLRSPQNWNLYPVSSDSTLFAGRGYTGHEHLPWFNLINMNGRLYDPLVGRFLSPDNEISSPGSTQGYNRYAYCRNNPLIAIDPDGNNAVLIAAIILGGIMNAQQAMMNSTKTSFGGVMGDIGLGFLKRAGQALLSAGAADMIGNIYGATGTFGNELTRATAHGFTQGGINGMFGGDFMEGAAGGFMGSLGASYAGNLGLGQLGYGITGAASGGLGAWMSGGDPLNGALSGGFVGIFNHDLHGVPHMHGTLPEVIIEGKVPKFGSAGIVSGFSVLKFVAMMNKNAISSYSLGKCASFVRIGLEYGGLNMSGHPYAAGDYGPFLIKKGFGVVDPLDYKPLFGDIAILIKPYSIHMVTFKHIMVANGYQITDRTTLCLIKLI